MQRGLEEVIVTAQRREQSLQDAAIPLATFDQESLTRLGMETAQDLGQLSPSLGITAGGGPLTSIFVRGVGALTVNPQTDAAVSQNVDGVYLGRSSGAAGQSLYDLERIELLKGPQGTLYGRNATGGVHQLHSKETSPRRKLRLCARRSWRLLKGRFARGCQFRALR